MLSWVWMPPVLGAVGMVIVDRPTTDAHRTVFAEKFLVFGDDFSVERRGYEQRFDG